MPVTAATAVAGADAAADPDADGQGAADAGALAAGALAPTAGALAPAAGALAPAAGALAGAADAGALAGALAAAEAHPMADCAIVVEFPPETAMMIPRVRPSAIGMASGTAIRAARLFPRRRDADLCPLSIQSTSMWGVPCDAPGITVDLRVRQDRRILKILSM
jgi:hypothetical protein